jgi:hypothetical protein
MSRTLRVQYFDSEGRENLPYVIKSVKLYLRAMLADGISFLPKIVFLTGQGEGPMLAYNQLGGMNVNIIAVTFPPGFRVKISEKETFTPEVSERVKKFFAGVEIPIVTGRLPFDEMDGADSHNKEMGLIRSALSIFGGSIPLAIQAALQATDAGLVSIGEQVIAVTSDTAVLITASTTAKFLSKNCGITVNEIICKPRVFTISRRAQLIERRRELSTDPETSPEIQPPSVIDRTTGKWSDKT